MTGSPTARAIVSAAAAMSCVGTLTAVSATIARYPVYGGQSLRYVIAALILLAIAGLRPGPRPALGDLALIAVLATTGLAAFNVFIVEATRYASPATIGTVVGSVPIALAVAGPLATPGGRRRPAARVVVAAVVVTLGAGLANGLGSGSLPGLLLSLGALGGEVCFSLLAVPLLPKFGPLRLSAYAAAAAVPILLITGLVVDGLGVLRMPTVGEVAGLGYLAVVATAGAFFLWYSALGRLGADRAGLFAGLVPISALATQMVLGIGTPTRADAAGAVLVAMGVIFGLRPVAGRRCEKSSAG